MPVGLPISQRPQRQAMGIVQSIFLFLRAFILGRAAAAVENLALRQQVTVAGIIAVGS